jgi:tetratricopeptide (TPR) repeat protein
MEKLVESKQWDEARRLGEGAIFVDVMSGHTHALYARALAAQNAHDKAVYEYETALTAGFKEKKDEATTHALLAQSLVALKRTADATKHRDEAVKLDPDNADAKAVKLP